MKKLTSFLKNIQFTEKSVPWILLAVCILAYGLLIPKLGYFQDDWNFIFNYYSFGDEGLNEFLQYDGRPYAAWIFNIGFKLLSFTPLNWHILELMLRWATGYFLWLTFQAIWPNLKLQTLSVSILFILYPFFTLQPLAVTYTIHWTGYLFYCISIYFMLKTNNKNFWLFTGLSLLSQIIHLFTIEYYAGIDLIRPILLWLAFSNKEESNKQKILAKTFYQWLPYLFISVAYFIWRGFIYQSPDIARSTAAGLNGLLETPIKTIAYSLANLIPDIILILFASWYKILEPRMFNFSVSPNIIIFSIRIFCFSIIYIILNKFRSEKSSNNKSPIYLKQFFTVGIAGLLAGLLPVYGAGYIIHTKLFPWNTRFGLASLFGSALIIYSLLEFLITSRKVRNFTMALLAGLLIGWHLQYTNDFRWAWDKQVNFYRQLILRAPEIKPKTAILSEEEFFSFMGDYPTAYGINLLYTPQGGNFGRERIVNYWFIPLAEFYTTFDEYLNGRPFSTTRAGTSFEGESNGSIVVSFDPELGRCLWVIRPDYAQSKTFSQNMRRLASISFIDRIENSPHNPNSFLHKYLYTNPEQDWCYYYQMADLANQFEKWDEVVNFWETANQNGLNPDNGFEYLPFIEAYAHTGDWDTAKKMTLTSQKTMKGIDPLLCHIWNELERDTPASIDKENAFVSVIEDLKCE